MTVRHSYSLLFMLTVVACAKPVRSGGIYFGPLPCEPPRAGPVQLHAARSPDPTLPAGRGALVIRFTTSQGDSVLRGREGARLRQGSNAFPLRRDSVAGTWIADSVAAGLYSLKPRFIAWATEEVTVAVRAGFVDTAVVPLERYQVCLFASRGARLPNGSLQLTSARSKEAIAVEWLDSPQTTRLVSRLASRSLAAELGR